MAGGIKIGPYKPLGVSTQAVPGGGYINVDASAGNFAPPPWLQLGLQAASGAASIAGVAAEQLAGDNEAIVKRADVQLGETEQALLFDPQTGYLNLQGQDAVTQAPTVLDTYAKAQDGLMATMADDDQRRMFGGIADSRSASFADLVNQHADAQRQIAYDQASNRRIELMQVDAGLHWNDDTLLRRTLGTTRAEVRDQAERKGWDTTRTQAAVHHYTSRALTSAIEAVVERDPDRAQALRKRYAAALEHHHAIALDALLTEAQVRQQAAAESAEILNATPPDGAQPTHHWRLQQTNTITDPAVRAATVRHLLSAAAAAELRARTLAEQVLERVLKDDLTDSSQIPLREWVALDAERRQAIETRLDHNAAGTEPGPNPALVDQLATQATQTPSMFAHRDLVPQIAHLPLPQWQRFRNWQAGFRRNDPAIEDELYAIKRGLQLATKMRPADKPGDITTNYRAELVEEIDTWRRINGKSPDDGTIREMVQRMLPSTEAIHAIKFPYDPEIDSPIHLARLPVPKRMERQAIDLLELLWLLLRGITIGLKADQDSTPPGRSTTPTVPPPADGRPSERRTPAPSLPEAERHSEPAELPLLLPRITPVPPMKPLPGIEPPKPFPPLPGILPIPAEPQILKGPEIDAPKLPTRLENIPQIEPGPLIVTSDNPSEDLKYFDLENWEWHHHFPRQWWKPNGQDRFPFGKRAMKFFDRQLILIPKGQHWGTLHSKYNEAIGKALERYLADKSQADIENMDETEAEKCFDEVIKIVREHGSAEAKEFLRNVKRFEPANDNIPTVQ